MRTSLRMTNPEASSSRTAGSAVEQLQVLRGRAGVSVLGDTRWIAVTGTDRVRWLNGMVTNSVQALTPGDGAYSFALSAQGRIQGDMMVWAEAERLLLETDAAQSSRLVELLDRFIIMDDVELREVEPAEHGLLVAGPEAVAVLQAAGLPVRASRLLKREVVMWREERVSVVHPYSRVVPRVELWMASAEAAERMMRDLLSAGADRCGPEALELLRILEGTPRYGVDIGDRDLPQETAQTRALHFSKGCYLGQEIVERIRSRGAVHRSFTQFVLHGAVPGPGTVLEVDGRKVGELTSVSAEPVDGDRLALGYARRDVLERGTALLYDGGRASQRGSAPPEARQQSGAS